jgi:ADP-ribose pyrophosphatase YjhB (NUDIX family)
MSDGDIFCRRAARGWRPVAKAFRDPVSSAFCGERITECVTRELREIGGLDSPELRRELQRLRVGSFPTKKDVVRALELLVRQRVADRVLPLAVGGRFASYREAQRFLHRSLESARLDEVADRLMRHPDAVGLRRPSRRRLSLDALLDAVAPLGSHA